MTEPLATEEETRRAISAAARFIGLLGASKGGKARAMKLDAYRRFEIASHAARVRWGRQRARMAAMSQGSL